MDEEAWRKCSTCKNPIAHSIVFYECSVSTCNRKRLPLFFCSVECWDAHVPMMRHRDAWAIEKTSPSKSDVARETEAADAAAKKKEAPRRIVTEAATNGDVPQDVLIIASKLKSYIKARSGMNTSDGVMRALSDHVRQICNEAIRNAARDDRKTVLDRDVAKVARSGPPGG